MKEDFELTINLLRNQKNNLINSLNLPENISKKIQF